jgi:hypothetical protein
MKQVNPVLFYTTEPRFGCSQPVRSGDLLIVKNRGFGWTCEGAPFIVIERYESYDCYDVIMIRGLVNSTIASISSEDLEWPNETG